MAPLSPPVLLRLPDVIHLRGVYWWTPCSSLKQVGFPRPDVQALRNKFPNAKTLLWFFFNVMLKFEAPSETFGKIIRKSRGPGIGNVLCLYQFMPVFLFFCADFFCESYCTLSRVSVLSFRFVFSNDSMTDLDFLSSSFKYKEEQQRFKSKSKQLQSNTRITRTFL